MRQRAYTAEQYGWMIAMWIAVTALVVAIVGPRTALNGLIALLTTSPV